MTNSQTNGEMNTQLTDTILYSLANSMATNMTNSMAYHDRQPHKQRDKIRNILATCLPHSVTFSTTTSMTNSPTNKTMPLSCQHFCLLFISFPPSSWKTLEQKRPMNFCGKSLSVCFFSYSFSFFLFFSFFLVAPMATGESGLSFLACLKSQVLFGWAGAKTRRVNERVFAVSSARLESLEIAT